MRVWGIRARGVLLAMAVLAIALAIAGISTIGRSAARSAAPAAGRYLYIAHGDGYLYVYSVPGNALVQKIAIPALTDGVRGVDADPASRTLYIAHGPDTATGSGHLLKFDLVNNTVVWNKSYSHGIDQFSLSLDGTKIYMPQGELASSSRTWYVLSASDGSQIGTLSGGLGPHNTITRRRTYMGGRDDTYFYGSGGIKIGPLPEPKAGVRPFTVNGAETRAWVTMTHYRGFCVLNLTNNTIVKCVNFGSVPSTFPTSAPSHGISENAAESGIAVLDTPEQEVRFYTASDSPTLIATVSVPGLTGTESGCAYDCAREGWLLHSRDGAYVYVGDSGAVINTSTHQVAYTNSVLANDRHGFIEIDWSSTGTMTTTTHYGMGYVGAP